MRVYTSVAGDSTDVSASEVLKGMTGEAAPRTMKRVIPEMPTHRYAEHIRFRRALQLCERWEAQNQP